MNIVVCLKPNVAPAAIVYDARSGAPMRPAADKLCQRDAVALQVALNLGGGPRAHIVALSVADERATPVLREALTAGANRAVRLWHADTGATLDTAAAATAAAAAVTMLGADLVLCAARSEDLGSELFAATLAAGAGFEWVSRAIAITAGDGGGFEVVQKLESGWRVRHRMAAPVVVAVEGEITRARHVTTLGRVYRESLARTIEVWAPADVGLAEMPPPRVREVELALPRPRARAVAPQAAKVSARDRLRRKKKTEGEDAGQQRLQGPPEAVAEQLLGRIHEWLA